MDIKIRQENNSDHQKVFDLTKQAFALLEISNHDEQYLVERLRKSSTFIPELSLVAESDGGIVGHIMLTKIKIANEKQSFDSLVLAPVSVLPEFQNKGIGGKLIEKAHLKAKELGYKSVVLVGHENYYPKFGYELTSKYRIKLSFDAPEKNCMVVELVRDGLKGVSGVTEFPKEFY